MSSGLTHDAPPADASGERPRGRATEPRAAAVEHVPPGGPLGAIVLLTLLIGVVLTAFALPAVHSEPRAVPIGLAGPAPAIQQVAGGLSSKAPGAFEVQTFADETALTQAIRDRDVYGGIALAPAGASVLTAPAASPAVAQGLSALATQLGQQQGRAVPVKEVVSLPAQDSRGAGLATALLPLFIAAIAPVLVMNRIVRGAWGRLAAVLSAAVVLGAALAGLLHWYDVFEGSWLLEASAMALVIAAMSATLLGLLLVAGLPGMGLGAALFLLVGNPLSGLATAPEFLAEPWHTIGAWLPPGAGGQLLRSAAYFDGAGAGPHLVVLGAWLALGLVLVALGAGRLRARSVPRAVPAATTA
ncbi:ABC transporter permease [Intrasporangium sp. DVR]|uniref:ABC transporter permease n=1 Tax=Intrasporangium sp. DVR TaxID=3127867 RepID=UPI00313A717F